MNQYKPFHERYSYGDTREVVPNSQLHARELSRNIKQNIRRLKGDLAKKPLLDPMTQSPVLANEYKVWRRRAAGMVKHQEQYLEKISDHCSRQKRLERRNSKRSRRQRSFAS